MKFEPSPRLRRIRGEGLGLTTLLLQEYDFDVVDRAGTSNLDADGLSRNPSPSKEDLIMARWHRDCDREAVPGWHASAYLASMVN